MLTSSTELETISDLVVWFCDWVFFSLHSKAVLQNV